LADPVDVGDDAPAGMPSPVEDAEVEDAARALDPLLTALLGQRAAAAEEEGGPAIGGPALATVGTGPTATRTDDGATVTGTARGRAAAAGRLSVAVDTPAGQRAAASSAVADARRMAELDALHGGASPTADAAAATAVAERLREGAPGVTGVTGATGAAAGGASPLAALAAASGTTAVVHAASNVTAGVVEGRLSAAPGQAGFAPELGAQLTLFVREGVQMARLQLHPAELGPVLVQIQLDGQAAQVHLAAENPFTRDKLGEALPVLAGSLREAGLTLSGGGVFEQPRRDDSAPGQGTSTTQGRNDDAARPEAADAGAQVVALPRRRGVVDLVA
jgi:flagellar hook-length control protein FliK